MKFTKINLTLFGTIVSSFIDHAVTSNALVHRRAAVEDYVLTWDGCDKALGDISAAEKSNIFCDYTILPVDRGYKVELFGWSGVKGEACVGTPPPMVDFTGVGVDPTNPYAATVSTDPQGTDQFHGSLNPSLGEFHTDIDIDRNEFLNNGQEETFHFCIRHDVMEDLDGDSNPETSLYFLKTFITVRFFLDGSFELNADSEGKIGDDDVVYTGDDDVLFPNDDQDIEVGNDDGTENFNDDLFDDDEGPNNGGGINVTENTTLSEVFDEFNKTYSVFAYQCEIEFPHAQTDEIIYQGDNLGICVETLFRDTFINDVLELELVQDNNAGGVYSTKPVTGAVDNVVTETFCNLNSRINEPDSKCFIKTAMLSQFFITQLVVNATGEVELLIRTTATNPPPARRLEESRTLQGIDGSYVVSAKVGSRNDVDASSNAISGSFKLMIGYGVTVSVMIASILLR